MSSAGHVLDMINRSKQNRALLKGRQERFEKIKEKYFKELSYHVDFQDRCKLSSEELIQIKQKIKKKIKHSEIKRISISVTITTLIIAAIIWFFYTKF